MSGNIEYRGLCSTCKHAPTCVYPRDPRRPAFYCEEFEYEMSPPMEAGVKDRPKPTEPDVGKARDSTEFFGLCIDCENRRACVFPKPEGGVWHCEEYQ